MDYKRKLSDFVTSQLIAFRDNTLMWGSLEAVELQAVLLLEVEVLMYGADLNDNPRQVLDMYQTILDIKYPASKGISNISPLHKREKKAKEFGIKLYDICEEVRNRIIGGLNMKDPNAN